MTETSEALNQQTEKLQTKEIEGQTVVLGPGFENSYQPEYLDNSEAMDLIKKENQESKYGMNKVNYNDIEVEDLPTDGIINKIKRYLGMEEEKEKQIIKARPGQQFDKDNVPTEDVKIEKVEKPVEEDIETPIIPKEKPSDNELLYSKLSSTNYFKSIRDVESKIVDGKIATEEERNEAVGDDGASLGSYQIQRNFFKESMEWLKSNNVFEDLHNKSYEDIVKDPNQATKIMFGYYMRYAPNLIKDLKLEQLARLHNGGPGALKSDKGIRLTNEYADKFNQILKSYSSQ
jgi:hypothetical protein